MKRSELLSSPEYWTQYIQLALYEALDSYLTKNHMSRTDFASQLGVTKGYVSQVMNGEFDHKLSKLVELSLACGMVPSITFVPLESYLNESTSRYKMASWNSPDFKTADSTTVSQSCQYQNESYTTVINISPFVKRA